MVASAMSAVKTTRKSGFPAGWRPPGPTMIHSGILFDRMPGTLEPIDFDMSVDSPEYQALWPWRETWCQELEVFHNPQAKHPIQFGLIPGATHWFERDGEIECNTIRANSIIPSTTHLRIADEPGTANIASDNRSRDHELPFIPRNPSPDTGLAPTMATGPSARTIVLHLPLGTVHSKLCSLNNQIHFPGTCKLAYPSDSSRNNSGIND